MVELELYGRDSGRTPEISSAFRHQERKGVDGLMETRSADVWLTRKDVAARQKLEPKTLAQWASQGRGPVFHKFGGHCRYRLSDVIDWENAQITRGGDAVNEPAPSALGGRLSSHARQPVERGARTDDPRGAAVG